LGQVAHADAVRNSEFITIFYGQDVDGQAAQSVLDLFTAACPNAEITLLDGGQPVYYYIISAE
jgi:dihydroxyacetone kinase-like predicted kinase